MKWNELPTPNFIVIQEIAQRNADTMIARADKAEVKLRPHVKTHKTVEGALLQCGGSPGPIVVSTLMEAEFFADHKFTDITYAVPIAAFRLARASKLTARISLKILLDHPDQLAAIELYSSANGGMQFEAFVKIDVGYHRAGVPHDADTSLDFVETVAASTAIRFVGLYAHAGHSYGVARGEGAKLDSIASSEAALITSFADRLKSRGVTCTYISIGSTPTCLAPILSNSGITDIHPGNNLFLDKQQSLTGTCDVVQDCAGRVVSTVVSAYPDRDRLVIDAGAMALSKDTCTEGGFGEIVGHPNLKIVSASQECSIVECDPSITDAALRQSTLSALGVGSVIQIVPNHACLAAACYQRYAVVDRDDIVVQWWHRCPSGW